MIIDVIALILLVIAIFKGIRKGLVVAIFSLIAFIIGLAAALKLSAAVAEYLSTASSVSQRWLPVLAFLIVFIIVVLLVRLGAKMIEGAMRVVMLGWLNKLGGIVFYLLLYFFVFSIVLFYAMQLQLIKPETAEDSVAYEFIQPIAPKVISWIGAVIPFFRDIFSELLNFFQNISDKHSPA